MTDSLYEALMAGRNLYQNDPYAAGGAVLASQSGNLWRSDKSIGRNLLYSLGASLLGGALGQYGRSRVDRQNADYYSSASKFTGMSPEERELALRDNPQLTSFANRLYATELESRILNERNAQKNDLEIDRMRANQILQQNPYAQLQGQPMPQMAQSPQVLRDQLQGDVLPQNQAISPADQQYGRPASHGAMDYLPAESNSYESLNLPIRDQIDLQKKIILEKEKNKLQKNRDYTKKAMSQSGDLQSRLSQIEKAEQLLPHIGQTGVLSAVSKPVILELQSNLPDYLSWLGRDEAQKELSARNSFASVSKALALAEKPEGSGSVSNFEQEIFQSIVPSLKQRPEANQFLIQTAKKLTVRDIEKNNFILDGLQKGRSIEDLESAWNQYIVDNPIITLQDVQPFLNQEEYINLANKQNKNTTETREVNGVMYRKVQGGWQRMR